MKTKKILVLDCEIYKNYSLFSFTDLNQTKYVDIEAFGEDQVVDRVRLRKMMNSYTIITFNGDNYDIPMVLGALSGWDCQKLKKLSDTIINKNLKGWQTVKRFNLPRYNFDHIDIMEPSPGVRVSLKLYGGRLHCPKLQDLPIEPDALITDEQRAPLREYCHNDLETTINLFNAIKHEIDLRQEMSGQYDVDLRSKSGAQVAKGVFRKLLQDEGIDVFTPEIKPGTRYRYNMPEWIEFESDELNEIKELVANAKFEVGEKGSVILPSQLLRVIKFDGAEYQLGIGGLHSKESQQAIENYDANHLFEMDVASYYPNIILGQSLYPEHLGHKFIDVYKGIVDRRLEAKRSGDKSTSESLKLVINSSFGLFGNKYAFLYSPQLLIQVTLTGQLCLLMLIEKVVKEGGRVVGANTDGINIWCSDKDYHNVQLACGEWEMITGCELEENRYKAIYNESVNSYIAIQEDGGVKSKGNFALPGLMKNPVNEVCIEACIEFLSNGVDIADYIRNCEDMVKFLTVRTVTGGAIYKGDYLGKAIRWYYGRGVDESIYYKKSGNRVPKSQGAVPIMELNEENLLDMANNISYEWYIKEAYGMLGDLGL